MLVELSMCPAEPVWHRVCLLGDWQSARALHPIAWDSVGPGGASLHESTDATGHHVFNLVRSR
jgi:hypothetical protein